MGLSETITHNRLAWSLAEVSQATGLSMGFLRNEARSGRLRTRRFGRRLLVLDVDLVSYLETGSLKRQSNA
jgi:hypothetical protein